MTDDNDCLSVARNVSLEAVAERARRYVEDARAANTRRAYASDWRVFEAWCAARSLASMPAAPVTVVLFLSEDAEAHKASSIGRRLAAIAQAHRAAGHADPTKDEAVRLTWRGIRRAHGTAQEGKAPVLVADVRRIVDGLPPTVQGDRDRALLLLGFAGAFRRSELVALDVEDLEFVDEGLVVSLRRSKTDQEGEGRHVGIPRGANAATCPVRAVRRWMDTAGIQSGPLFLPVDRHGHVTRRRLADAAVAEVVKKRAASIGMDPSRVSGHSLRAGFATSAACAGVEERAIADQTGHRSMAVLRRYIRPAGIFQGNAAGRVGL